jgi:hypothetical protein
MNESLNADIESIRSLKEGWDTYGGAVPTPASIEAARRIAEVALSIGLEPSKICPSAEGGTAVAFVRGDKYAHLYADVECLNTGEITAVTSDRKNVEAWEVTEGEIRAACEKIRSFLNVDL